MIDTMTWCIPLYCLLYIIHNSWHDQNWIRNSIHNVFLYITFKWVNPLFYLFYRETCIACLHFIPISFITWFDMSIHSWSTRYRQKIPNTIRILFWGASRLLVGTSTKRIFIYSFSIISIRWTIALLSILFSESKS